VSARTAILPYKAGAWSVVLRVFGALATLATGVLLGRTLGPAGLGQFGLIVAAAMLLASLAQLGLPTVAVREIAVSRMEGDWRRLRTVVVWFGGVTLACALLLALVFALSGWVLFDPDLRPALLWGALLVPAAAMLNLLGTGLRGLDRLVRGQALDVAVRPALMSLLLLAAYFGSGGMTPASALAANLAAFVLALALGGLWLRRAMPAWEAAPRRPGELRGWLRSAAPLALTDTLRQFDGVYGVLVVGALASDAETGIFRVAASSLAIVAIPNTVMHVLLAPTLARLYAAGDFPKLRSLLTASARIMLFTLCAGSLVIALIGEWLLGAAFGAAFMPSYLPLLILTAAQAVNAFFGLGSVLLAMSAAEKALARCFTVTALVSVATAIPLTIAWGASGAAMSAVLGYLAGNALAWLYVRRSTGLDSSAIGLPARAAVTR
jgi:O-antigen/teichoic acid export membrane protein